MKKTVGNVLLILASMLIMLGLVLMWFERTATDSTRYDRYQAALDLYDDVGVSKDELVMVQSGIARYLQGKLSAAEMNREVEMRGVVQPIFNDREMAHMLDVQALFGLGRRVRVWSLVVGAAMFVLAAWLGARWHFAGFVALGIWALVAFGFMAVNGFDFDRVFTQFHELLFDNDLWLLDPRTDAMIRMYPIRFFEWMARDIGIAAALGALVGGSVPLVLGRKGGKA